MRDADDGQVLARLRALSGNPNEALLALLALGRAATTGAGEMPWSVAEVTLADLATRFTAGNYGVHAGDRGATGGARGCWPGG
jgi:hypothetical protein